LKNKYIALIVARQDSKGLRKKNLLKIAGKPCIFWSITAAINSKIIKKSILSTDCKSSIKIAKKIGLEVPFVRPKKLSRDDSSIIDVINHSCKWLNKNNIFFNYIVLLQASSPLRTSKDIDDSIKFFEKTKKNKNDILVSVKKVSNKYHWLMKKEKNYIKFLNKQKNNLLRQQNPDYYIPNGSIFILKYKKNIKKIYTDKVIPFIMSENKSIDIDDFEDLQKARKSKKKSL
jgi:CMP-N,N'-diacetyllegionaminic acid synthase